jgi:hypothetical protein
MVTLTRFNTERADTMPTAAGRTSDPPRRNPAGSGGSATASRKARMRPAQIPPERMNRTGA